MHPPQEASCRYRQRPRSRAAEAGPRRLPSCGTAAVELLAHLVWPRNVSTYLSAGRRYPHPSRPAPLVGRLKWKCNGKGNDPVAEVKQKWWDFKRRDS